MIGRFLCRIGLHRWGKEYPTAGHDWAFGMGHHAQDCKRADCDWVRRHHPGVD